MTSRLILISGFELNVLWQQIQLERSKYKMLVKKKAFIATTKQKVQLLPYKHKRTPSAVKKTKEKKHN